MEFIEILKDIMQEKGLNQTELANVLGLKQAQISEWLNGKSLPGYSNLKLICRKLNISGDKILGLII
ncbi:MAG: helix-turn-helix domain-containing protein [Firmicutes bacterium]|nr:helix-turn-helix domain-containing protein [Bacillota bacterium]